MLIDTHCHLNFREAFPDLDSTLNKARQNGIIAMVVIGCDEQSSEVAVQLAEKHEPLYAVVGWHPNYSANYDSSSLARIEELCSHAKVVGVGEIGLDNHWNYATKAQQLRSLDDQFELAIRMEMPVVIHCREAWDEMIQWLQAKPQLPPSVVLHCFSGDRTHAEHAARMGCYFGFDGPITYRKSEESRTVAATVPRDKILIETDSPYLSPHPYRNKPNEPALLPIINSTLAGVLRLSPEECGRLTTENAIRCFRLPVTA